MDESYQLQVASTASITQVFICPDALLFLPLQYNHTILQKEEELRSCKKEIKDSMAREAVLADEIKSLKNTLESTMG